VKAEGALGLKVKEHIAVGIAVAQRCAPCIAFHVEALMKAGATREELVETLGMAIQMGGGPALMYAASALACWDELAAAKG
jgi:AhpD family alkylhydroperoxidase